MADRGNRRGGRARAVVAAGRGVGRRSGVELRSLPERAPNIHASTTETGERRTDREADRRQGVGQSVTTTGDGR